VAATRVTEVREVAHNLYALEARTTRDSLKRSSYAFGTLYERAMRHTEIQKFGQMEKKLLFGIKTFREKMFCQSASWMQGSKFGGFMTTGSTRHTAEVGVEPRKALVRMFIDCLRLGLEKCSTQRSLEQPRAQLARSEIVREFFKQSKENGEMHSTHTLLQELLEKPALVSVIILHPSAVHQSAVHCSH
jgi:hypothetical protein